MENFLNMALKIVAVIIFAASIVRIAKEYQRGVVFRLGRFYKVKGPGLYFIIPLIDRVVKVDLRLISIDVPRQEIMTKDNVPVTVDAVVYFRITSPKNVLVEVSNYYQSTFLIAQTTLRSVLGESDLDELLSNREVINKKLQQIIDEQTKPWGVQVAIVEVKEVALPENMKRAMAKQAEKERERRAKIIDSLGEFQAAENLVQAAKLIQGNPIALQLRYVQLMREASVEKNSTYFFPYPSDMLFPSSKEKSK